MMDVSAHAASRAKERLSWNLSTIERMAERALAIGIEPKTLHGRIRRYIDGKLIRYVSVDTIRIYGEYIYFYCRSVPGYVLVTVYRVPGDLVHLIPRGEK